MIMPYVASIIAVLISLYCLWIVYEIQGEVKKLKENKAVTHQGEDWGNENGELARNVYIKFLTHDDTWMEEAKALPTDNDAWLKLAQLIHVSDEKQRGERKESEVRLMVNLLCDLASKNYPSNPG